MLKKSKSFKACISFALTILLNLSCISYLPLGGISAEERAGPVINRIYNGNEPKLGEKVRFIAEAEGDNLQYEFHLFKDDKEIYVEEYSANNYFDYVLNEEGTYRVDVKVKDEASNESSKSSDNIIIKKETVLKINSLTVDKKGAQLIGTALKFTVSASGEGLSYEWSIYKGSIVIYKKQLSKDNFIIFTPKETGSYKASVTVKDNRGAALSRTSETVQILNAVKLNSITVDKGGKQPVNTTLQFKASAIGYNVLYEWHIYKDKKEVYKGVYGKYNYIKYTPKQPGVYNAQIFVKDGFGKFTHRYSANVTVYAKPLTAKESAEAFVNNKGFSSKTKNFIWVDTAKNVVYVFEGKAKNWKLIRTMSCTDGKASTPTIKGTFAINGRGPWLISPSNSNVRARYKVRIYGGYYFHSILVNSKGRVIDSRLGQSLSHGCVRLSMDNAKWMYYNIKDGTGVHIS